ncbi:MAG: hypothetical protein AB7N80_02735 [Bdellovibrionales bacterium]
MQALFLSLFLTLNVAHGQELVTENDLSEYRHQVEGLNQRYEDFFAHEERLRRYEDNLKRAVPDQKAERRRYEREAEAAMREHRLHRRERADTAALEQQDAKEKRAQAAVQERHRRDYVTRREQLRRISESARKIPANRDAGLE